MKIIVRLSAVLLSIALAVLAGLFIFVSTFDAGQYRQEIETALKKLSGYTIHLRGPLSLDLFPELHLNAENLQLADPAGLAENLASAEKISARVSLLPLLEKKLRIGTIRLHNLRLHLIKDENGRKNWELEQAKPGQENGGGEKPGGSMPVDFKIDSLELADAEIIWDDRRKRQRFQLSELRLETGPLQADAPVGVHLSGLMNAKHLQAIGEARFSLDAQLSFDQAFEQIKLQNAAIDAARVQDGRILQTMELNGDASLRLDDGEARIELEKAKISELEVHGSVRLSNLNQSPQVQAELISNTFNLRSLAKALSIKMPAFSSRETLSRLQIQKSRWRAEEQLIELEEALVRMDDSRINLHGHAALSAAQDTVLYAEIDRVALDPYLEWNEDESDRPSLKTGGQNSRAAPWGGGAVSLHLAVGRLDWNEVRAEKINGKIKMHRDLLEAQLVSADLFDGAVHGQLKRTVREARNQWQLDFQGRDLAVKPMLSALHEKDGALRGRASVDFSGTAEGLNEMDLRKSLEGRAQLSLRQAGLTNAKLARTIERVLAVLEGRPMLDRGRELIIQSARASLKIERGVADNRDLDLRMPLLAAGGSGKIDFVRRRLDYTLKVQIKDRKDLPSVSVLIRGPFDNLSYTPQLSKIIAEQAAEKIKEKVKAGREKIEEKISPKLDELKEKINPKLDELRDLLKF